jgi:hypothetical protein
MAENLREQRAKLVKDWRDILDKAEGRGLNADEKVAVEAIERDIDAIKARVDAAEKLDKLEAEERGIVPESQRDHPAVRRAERLASSRRVNVLHLIYDDHDFEGHFKDYQFGLLSMRDHWRIGLHDLRGTIAQPGWLDKPAAGARPFVTHDLKRLKRTPS